MKSVGIYNPTAVSGDVIVWTQGPAASHVVVLFKATMATVTYELVDRWWVLNPGDQLVVYSSSSGLTFWISGTVLTPPTPWDPGVPTVLTVVPPEIGTG